MRSPARPDLADPALYQGVMWRRICAFLIDACLLGLLALLAWTAVGVLGVLTLGLLFPLLAPLVVALPLAYRTLAVASRLSATPGQALLGLVVRSEPDGGRPNVPQAFAAALLFTLTLAGFGVLLVAALLSWRGRTLHDFFSGTVVVRAAALAARERSTTHAAHGSGTTRTGPCQGG